MVEIMAELSAMVRLDITRNAFYGRVALSDLIHLEHLDFANTRYITDIVSVATRLEHLERIHFGKSKLEHVKLFMSANLKLEMIKIQWFVDDAGHIEQDKVLNLIQLNKIRVKLRNAEKITLYIGEDVYLATKRINRETDLDFIKLKRWYSSNETNVDFYPLYYGKISDGFRADS